MDLDVGWVFTFGGFTICFVVCSDYLLLIALIVGALVIIVWFVYY